MIFGRSLREWMGITVFVLICLALLRIWVRSQHDFESLPAPTRQPAPILDHALSNYTPEQYPKTYATWGVDGIERIKEMEKAAAQHVARSSDCDRVDYVGLSENRSSPPSNIVVYIDCSNRNRFYVGDAELSRDPALLKGKPSY
ncbi:hypothetical protein D3C84_979050 [compost metagenome]